MTMHQLILTTEEGEALRMFEGKTVVPLDAESANYREWLVTVNHIEYCITCETCDGDMWALMYYVPDIAQWVDAPGDVDTFLISHRLILAN
jgi:hypothetical protein